MGRVDTQDFSGENLEGHIRLLWSAYAYLQDTDLRQLSGTSRLLHEAGPTYLGPRLSDELRELAGVLTREHRHRTLAEDVVLEGSQVCYWTYLAALRLGASYEELEPHKHLLQGTEQFDPPSAVADRIGGLVERLASCDERTLRGLLPLALRMVGSACRACGVDVLQVVSYDLQQMQARDYMQPYFASVAGDRG